MTDDVDVAAIAASFGGGGHPRAAGVQIEGGPEAKEKFLRGVAEAIRLAPDGPEPSYVSDVVID
jgi:nanoRNase/pAp phosphatase (c-di-AMP/oligoRNAs hydrolase)